ncbi:carbohydrate-binding domain-containing protein [Agromyces archimandritae]|uniref:Carbohydrate-binding domain-containing protein n=1 Tax=Agromyces archimandritae TaxID=2781962 RepID=A0A975FPM6_9MICO|nr:carbohydrate-binding domain-containing protein [Agromyces archimandritae]QTX05699.1 carbohydrate-binding domain-containing protein [Agromyces archimandritae]
MRTPKTLAALAVATTLGLAACTATETSDTSADTGTEATEAALAVDVHRTADEILADNQQPHEPADASRSNAVDIALDGDTAAVDAAGADGEASVDGGVVTISQAGDYRLHGSFDGGIVVDSPGEGTVRLILDDAEIAAADSAAIFVAAADDVEIVLADGSRNTLSDTAEYAADDEAGAALDSKADLTISGDGSLEVTGNGNDGIASSDGLVIEGGRIDVNAADDGIRGKDYAVLAGGTITVEAGGDALKADNEEDAERGYVWISGARVTATAGNDAVDAASDVVVTGGAFEAVAGAAGATGEAASDDAAADDDAEESASKGIVAGVIAVLEGGAITVDAADDAVHSNGGIRLADGTATLTSGDDAVHADGTLLAAGATVDVLGSVEGLEGAKIEIEGGELDIVASDDGINGSDGSGAGEMGGFPGGTPPEGMPEGGMPEGGTPPSGMPEGGMPEGGTPPSGFPADGERPEPPAGGEGGRRGEAPAGAAPDGGAPGGESAAASIVEVTISGGTVHVDAAGDGIDVNGTLAITGGDIVVDGPDNDGNAALDVDGDFTIAGGTLLAVGSAGMAMAPTADSEQGSVSVRLDTQIEAGQAFTVVAEDGTVIASHTAIRTLASVVASGPGVENGATYEVRAGDATVGSAVAGEQVSGGFGGGPRG